MFQSFARIVQRNGRWCVLSKTSDREFGCYSSLEAAQKRLKQIDYFKHIEGSCIMNEYGSVFDKFAQAFQNGTPQKIDLFPNSLKSKSNTGTLAGHQSQFILDNREHFPVATEAQARSSLNRAMQLQELPAWYSGSLANLRKEVYEGVLALHPNIEKLNVSVPIERVVGLSDGQEDPETSLQSIKNPIEEAKTGNEVPQAKRPNLKSTSSETIELLIAQSNTEAGRITLAKHLTEELQDRMEKLENAMGLAQRLQEDGLTASEFELLDSYLQSEVLSSLLARNVKGELQRRQEIINRLMERK